MALAKSNIQYTPFQEISFGYGNTEIAENYSGTFSAGDQVKVTLSYDSGNWDDTGHILTPSVGTAISVYNKTRNQWVCEGTLEDVDSVLSQLKFFPADKPSSRPYSLKNLNGFNPAEFRENLTTGDYYNFYPDEEPDAIGDTQFTLLLSDPSNSYQTVANVNVVFNPVEPSYGNQRPYWSTVPTHEDIGDTLYHSENGKELDFGIISHGTDTENVTVSCEFKKFNSSSNETSNVGYFVDLENYYIGDKRSDAENEKFKFTGSVSEAQAFLDNLTFRSYSDTTKTFDMRLEITDGVVGSYYTKSIWHTQTLNATTLPNQSFKEDTTSTFDLSSVRFSNRHDLSEVNSYKVVITLDSTGQGGATSFGTTTTVDTETYQSGVLTIIDSDYDTFLGALSGLEFVPVADFNSDFTFTVDFYFENSDINSSYASAQQIVDVSGEEAKEVDNIDVTHNWNEDEVYYFRHNNPLRIIHPVNENFRVDFSFSSLVSDSGDLATENTNVVKSYLPDEIISFTGTRDELNDALETMYFVPAVDFDQSFTMDVTVERTSGDLTFETPSTGIFTMTSSPQIDITIRDDDFGAIQWQEDDATLYFSSNIFINDTASDDPLLPAFEADYTLTLRSKYEDHSEVASSDIQFSFFEELHETVQYSGSGTISDPLIITTKKSTMQKVLDNLTMTPSVDFTATQPFRVEYRLERGTPTDEYYRRFLDYTTSTSFEKGEAHNDFYVSPDNIEFGEERITLLYDMYKITDRATDKQYTLQFTLDSNGQGFLRANNSGASTQSWDANAKRLTLTGSKTDLNQTLKTLEYIPTFNFTTSFNIHYYQKQETDNITHADGVSFVNMSFNSSFAKYQQDLINRFYFEDDQDQEILKLTSLKNLDGAEFINIDNLPLHYVTTLNFNPSDQIYFDGNGYTSTDVLESDVFLTQSTKMTFTGSRDECNSIVRNTLIDTFPDQNSDVTVEYTQERWLDNKYNELQADNVNGVIVEGNNVGEVDFTSQIQYITHDNAKTATGEIPTSKYLQEYKKKADTDTPVEVYLQPFNIIDNSQINGAVTLYNLKVIGHNFPSDVTINDYGYLTKQNFHNQFKNGLSDLINIPEDTTAIHDTTYSVIFRIGRKLGDGTILENLEENTILFKYRDTPSAYQYDSELINPVRSELYGYYNGYYGNNVYSLTQYFEEYEEVWMLNKNIKKIKEIDVVQTFSYKDVRNTGNWEITEDSLGANMFRIAQNRHKPWIWKYKDMTDPVTAKLSTASQLTGDSIEVKQIDVKVIPDNIEFDVPQVWRFQTTPNNRKVDLNKPHTFMMGSIKFHVVEGTKSRTSENYVVKSSERNYKIEPDTISSAYVIKPYNNNDSEQDNILQTMIDEVGLIGELSINYNEIISKSSPYIDKSIPSDQYGDPSKRVIYDTYNNHLPMTSHDSGDDLGAFTLSPDNLLHQDDTDKSNAVLCSHFWVSQNKYAFNQMNSHTHRYYDSKTDLPYSFNTPYGLNDDGTSMAGYNHSTSRRYLRAPDWDKIQRVGKQSKNDGLNLEIAFTSAFRLRSETRIPRKYPSGEMTADNHISDYATMWFGSSDIEQKTAKFFSGDWNRNNFMDKTVDDFCTATIFRDVPDTDEKFAELRNDKDSNYDGSYAYKFISSNGVLNLVGSEFVFNEETKEHYSSNWEVDLLSAENVSGGQIDKKSGRYDYAIGNFESYKIDNFLFYRPKTICITYTNSYDYRSKCYILENDKTSIATNANGNPINNKPKYKITKSYWSRYGGWARRTPQKNCGYIFPVRDDEDRFLLAGGDVVNSKNDPLITSNKFASATQPSLDNPVLNLKTQIPYDVENFLRLPSGNIVYVDKNGTIDDGTGNYNIWVDLMPIDIRPLGVFKTSHRPFEVGGSNIVTKFRSTYGNWTNGDQNLTVDVHVSVDRIDPTKVYFMVNEGGSSRIDGGYKLATIDLTGL